MCALRREDWFDSKTEVAQVSRRYYRRGLLPTPPINSPQAMLLVKKRKAKVLNTVVLGGRKQAPGNSERNKEREVDRIVNYGI